MRKALKVLWKGWSILSSLAVLAALLLVIGSAATGRLTAARARALRDAAFGESPAIATTEQAEAAKAPSGPAPAAPPSSSAPAPGALLGEIEKASMDLRMWEDRLDLLGRDLGKRLVTVGEKDQTNQEAERSWNRIRKAMVPLLNQLLSGTEGWVPITEEEFVAALEAPEGGPQAAGAAAASARPESPQGGDASAVPSRRLSLPDLMERLRRREAALSEGVNSLKGLSPDVLAGILAAGLKGASGGAGGPTRTEGTLSEEEAVRLLSTLDPGKLARVFKSLREESPDRAAALLSLLLKRSEAQPAKAPADPGTGVGGLGNKTSGKKVGGGEKQG